MISASLPTLKKTSGKGHYVWPIFLCTLIFIHIWTVYRLSVNMPYMDDYTFLVDIIHLKASSFTAREVADILLVPHGPHKEHMLVFARLTAILDYLIEGELNFRTLYFVGNGALIATVLLLFYIARRAGLSGIQILPIAFLLFQPQYYEVTMTWAICALQHVPALFFAFLAFWLLAQPSTALYILSFPVAMLATFSNGNGLAVLISGFLLLLVSRKYARLTTWVVFSLVSFLLYYQCTHGQPSIASAPTNLTHPLRVLGGFFLISGSLFSLFTQSVAGLSFLGAVITGLLAVVAGTLVAYLTGFSYYLKRLPASWQMVLTTWSVPPSRVAVLPLIACYVYLTITILGIAYARSIGWHYALLLPRFIWFTTVLIGIGYLLIMIWLHPVYRGRVSQIVLGLSLCFSGASYWFTIGEVMTVRKSLISDCHNWRQNGLLISIPPGEQSYGNYYSMILGQAIEQKIYRLPMPEFERQVAHPSTRIDANLKLVERDNVFRYAEHKLADMILTKKALPPVSPAENSAFVVLRSKEHVFVWPVDQSIRKLARFLMDGKPVPNGNLVTVSEDVLPEASYQVGLLNEVNGQWKATYSSKIINVDHHLYLASDKKSRQLVH